MFISIITVVYNGEKTIERTIKSILEQDFKNYEYIIQDGGSTDATLNIIRSYEGQFEGRLKIYSESDKGIYDAMNKGIKHASGDYIWLVNADDYICDDALSYVYNYCKSINMLPAVISSRMNIIDALTGKLKTTTSSGTFDIYSKACQNLKMGICHPATIVHKDIYNIVGLYDDRYFISADIDFSIRCYQNNVDVKFTDLIITNMTDGGISNKFPIDKNMHDCHLRTEKFCKSKWHKLKFTIWFFFRLLMLKIVGFRS